jgi:hypothetical protein
MPRPLAPGLPQRSLTAIRRRCAAPASGRAPRAPRAGWQHGARGHPRSQRRSQPVADATTPRASTDSRNGPSALRVIETSAHSRRTGARTASTGARTASTSRPRRARPAPGSRPPLTPRRTRRTRRTVAATTTRGKTGMSGQRLVGVLIPGSWRPAGSASRPPIGVARPGRPRPGRAGAPRCGAGTLSR